MVALSFGLFGLVVGSFLNVVILRHGKRGLGGRSACMTCATPLKWYDMIPVLSWILLRGKCRSCKGFISIQYPLVEAATGVSFALIGASPLPLVAIPLGLLCACLFICIFVYDLRHMIIPDVWVWPLCALALLFGFAANYVTPLSLYLLAGPIAALPLFALWLVSQGRWMGLGDAKLTLGIGWLLGFPLGVAAVLFGFILGAIISVGILLPLPALMRMCGIRTAESSAHYTMKSEVPFGPFLIAGCFLVWSLALYGIPIPLFTW